MQITGDLCLNSLGLGVIGLGQIGRIHLYNALHSKDIRFVAVADKEKKSQLLAKKMGAKVVCADYEELLKDSRIDCTVISLPNFLHAEAAISAAEHGKHILIEKPLARNSIEGESILSAVERNGVKLMIGYPLRFSPIFVNIKRELEAGRLGDVQIAVANHISSGPFSHRFEESIPKAVPSWWFDKNLVGGGVLLDIGCHMINLLRWYFGKVSQIQSHLGYRLNMDFEDYAICIMEFQNKTIATLNMGWFARSPQISVNLYGTVNNLSGVSQTRTLLSYVKKILKRTTSSEFRRELEHFVYCAKSDIDPSPSGAEGLEDLRIISAAYNNAF